PFSQQSSQTLPCWVVLQRQRPFSQTPESHWRPQRPQWKASVSGSTQVPLQSTNVSSHTRTHCWSSHSKRPLGGMKSGHAQPTSVGGTSTSTTSTMSSQSQSSSPAGQTHEPSGGTSGLMSGGSVPSTCPSSFVS